MEATYGKENDRVYGDPHSYDSSISMDESAIGNEGELAAEQYDDTEKANNGAISSVGCSQ